MRGEWVSRRKKGKKGKKEEKKRKEKKRKKKKKSRSKDSQGTFSDWELKRVCVRTVEVVVVDA